MYNFLYYFAKWGQMFPINNGANAPTNTWRHIYTILDIVNAMKLAHIYTILYGNAMKLARNVNCLYDNDIPCL